MEPAFVLPPPDIRELIDYYKYIHINLKRYIRRLVDVFTWKFLGFLVCTQFLLKGIAYSILTASMLPIFKSFGVDALRLQITLAMASSPWTVKPVLGLLSDLVRIGGYKKRYWLTQAYGVGLLGSAFLIPAHLSGITAVLVLCFVALNHELAVADLLSEGKYAELMRDNPETGSDIVTLVTIFQTLGAIIGVSITGPLSDTNNFIPLYAICIFLAITPIAPTLLGWLPEEKVGTSCYAVDMSRSKFRKEKWLYLVVGAVGVAGPLLATLAVYTSDIVGTICVLVISAIFCVCTYAVFPRMVGHVALYLVLSRLSKPVLGTALDYFYTADESCVPGGPSFTFYYFIMITGIVGSCISFFGSFLYQIWLSRWKFRSVLILTTILIAIAGVTDVMIVKRINLSLGISDKTFFLLGEAVLESLVNILYWIPSSALISKVCPKKYESTTYAYMAGLHNFALMGANLLGATIFKAAGVTTTPGPNGEACDFSSLWWLVLLCHIALPLAVGIPASWLIPNTPQTAELNEDGTERAEPGFIQIEEEDDGLEMLPHSERSVLELEYTSESE